MPESHIVMDPFFPDFLSGVLYLLRTARCALVPRIVCPSVKSTWISAVLDPGMHNRIAWNASTEQQNLFHYFLSFLLGCLSNLFVPEFALFAEFASRFRFVILTYGEDAKNHMTDSYCFH